MLQVLLLLNLGRTQCARRSDSYWNELRRCMLLPGVPLSLSCDGFYHITRDHWNMCGERCAWIVVVKHV